MSFTLPSVGQAGPSWASDINGTLTWLNNEKAQRVIDLTKPEYGYVMGGGDNTAALVAAINDANSGDHLLLPNDVVVTDPVVCSKMLTVEGWGPYTSWLKPRTSISTALWTWDLPSSPPGGSIRNYYGATMRGIGFDLSAAANARGVEVGVGTHHVRLTSLFLQGGYRHIVNKGMNNRFTDIWCADASDAFIWVDGDTGMELTLNDIKMARNSTGTTRVAIEVICASATGVKGGLWMTNVLQGAALGGANVNAGLIMSAPSNIELPLFADRCTFDNLSGPGLTFTNIRKVNFCNGWVNSANGGPCVRISGGGILMFAGNHYFGGGTPTKTYDFTGGSTGLFSSQGNYCPTNTIYFFPASGKPAGPFYADDISVLVAPTPVCNDMAHFNSIAGFRMGPQRFQDPVSQYAVPRGSEATNGPNGLATLVGGSVTVSHTGVTAGTRVKVYRWNPSGTLGNLFSNPAFNVVGTSFTINSSSSTDTSSVYWELREPV